jgi:hypothetical protein
VNDAELRTLAVGLGGTTSSPDMLLLLNPTETECEFQLPSFSDRRLGRGARHRASGRRVVGISAARGPVKVGPYQTLALQRVH